MATDDSKRENGSQPELLSTLKHTVLRRKATEQQRASARWGSPLERQQAQAREDDRAEAMLKQRIFPWALIGITVLALIIFFPLLPAIFLAVTVALVLHPTYYRVVKFFQLSHRSERIRSVFSVAFTSLVAVMIMAALTIPVIVLIGSLDKITDAFDLIRDGVSNNEGLKNAGINIDVARYEALAREKLEGLAGAFLGDFAWLLLQFFTFGVILYLSLRYGAEIYRNFVQLLPERPRLIAHRFADTIKRTCYAIYVVHFATVFATFILAMPFFYFVLGNVPGGEVYRDNWLFWSVIASIFQLIPFIGPTLVMVGIAGYEGFAHGNVPLVVWSLTVGYGVVCISPDWLLRPWLMGKQTKVHAMVIWLGFFGGIALMGIPGFVFGPLLLAIVIQAYKITLELYSDPLDGSAPGTRLFAAFRRNDFDAESEAVGEAGKTDADAEREREREPKDAEQPAAAAKHGSSDDTAIAEKKPGDGPTESDEAGSPAESKPGAADSPPGEPDRTEPDRTEPDRTEPDRTEPDRTESEG